MIAWQLAALLPLMAPAVGQTEAKAAQVPTYQVQGKVIDAQGKPVVGADISTFWMAEPGAKAGLRGIKGLKTGLGGTFRGKLQVYGLPATLIAFDKEHKRGARLTLTQENIGKPHTLTVRPLGRVRLGLTGEAGPLDHGTMVILDELSKGQIGHASASGKLDLGLPAGTYTLLVFAGSDTKSISRKVTLTPGATVNLGNAKMELVPYAKAYGKPAMPLTLGETRGVPADFKLENLKGKWVLLEFWGFW